MAGSSTDERHDQFTIDVPRAGQVTVTLYNDGVNETQVSARLDGNELLDVFEEVDEDDEDGT